MIIKNSINRDLWEFLQYFYNAKILEEAIVILLSTDRVPPMEDNFFFFLLLKCCKKKKREKGTSFKILIYEWFHEIHIYIFTN